MRSTKIIGTIILIFALVLGWSWLNKHDYGTKYNDLTSEEMKKFEWQDGDNNKSLQQRYRLGFSDTLYSFPRQNVYSVKLFRNVPLIGPVFGKTLRPDEANEFLEFFKDSTNFGWSETTWTISESEYCFKLYGNTGNIIGKVFVCLECSMIYTRPFSPIMKFGELSESGHSKIKSIVDHRLNF